MESSSPIFSDYKLDDASVHLLFNCSSYHAMLFFFWNNKFCLISEDKEHNKSYDDSVKLKRTEMDPFRLG